MDKTDSPFVSRAGQKLRHALAAFCVTVDNLICADLGCSTGGFTDCLIRNGAKKVYAVDTGYGVLDYTLRKNARVVVMERTNAMHVRLPEPVSLVTIDVAWTRQRNILPAAARLLGADGRVISLIKPHYESPAEHLDRGILPMARIPAVLDAVRADAAAAGFFWAGCVESPVKGAKGNTELLALLTRAV